MPNTTYYVQECPTCGRGLQVRVEYLGKKVVCQHCSSRFMAVQPGADAASQSSLMQRAEQLLKSAEASGIGIQRETSRHSA